MNIPMRKLTISFRIQHPTIIDNKKRWSYHGYQFVRIASAIRIASEKYPDDWHISAEINEDGHYFSKVVLTKSEFKAL